MEDKTKVEQINVSDSVKIHDVTEDVQHCSPVTGIITIYDKDGKVIAKTHNMIVKTGRRYILDAFLRASGLTSQPTASSSQTVTFSSKDTIGNICFAFEATPSITTEDMTTVPNTTDIAASTPIKEVTYDASELSIKISKTIDNTAASSLKKFNEIYTLINGDTLFSRALIDPIYVGEDTSYQIEYKFYF